VDRSSDVKTLPQLLAAWAADPQSADDPAIHFRRYLLGEVEPDTVRLSFRELAQLSMGAARRIAEVTSPGECVLIVADAGLAYHVSFFGCALAGVLPVPLCEPLMPAQLTRLRSTANDCRATLALTGGEREARTVEALESIGLRTLSMDRSPGSAGAHLTLRPDEFIRARAAGTSDLAYLQYTSGSTGVPKGVMVGDAQLIANLKLTVERLRLTAADRLVCWAPPYHDMGLVFGILLPLWIGSSALMMRPNDFAAAPHRWLSAMSEFRATCTTASNFAYDLCSARVPASRRAQLDLSRLRVMLNGAEPVRLRTIRNFLSAYAECGVTDRMMVPGYGLAEATLVVSIRDPDLHPLIAIHVDRTAMAAGELRLSQAPDAAALVSCGSPGRGFAVRIADPTTGRPLGPLRFGEVWISGESVCRGYWNDRTPANLVHEQGQTWLRTGDIGCLYAGELYISGRIKDVIIHNGVNLHPADLEETVERSHPSLRTSCSAVFGVDDGERERVIVLIELLQPSSADCDAIRTHVVDALRATHALTPDEVVLLRKRQLVRTTSGKLARAACRDAFRSGAFDVVSSWERSFA
jgi:long chain fatty acid CoA FadD26